MSFFLDGLEAPAQIGTYNCGASCAPLETVLRASSGMRRAGILAVHAKGTASILRPDAQHLSPAVGLVALNSSALVGNLLRCRADGARAWGAGASGALARELFFQPTRADPVRATRRRSVAAAHATPTLIGHLLGLGLAGAGREEVAATLARYDVRSNRVRGVWTGVSLARWQRLPALVAEAHADGGSASPAPALLLRLLWEVAEGRGCLLDCVQARRGGASCNHSMRRASQPKLDCSGV